MKCINCEGRCSVDECLKAHKKEKLEIVQNTEQSDILSLAMGGLY